MSTLNDFGSAPSIASMGGGDFTNQMFFRCLLQNLPEGVIFLDQFATIRVWNTGIQQLTGIGATIVGRRLEPSILKLKDSKRIPISDSCDIFGKWVSRGKLTSERYFISGRSGRDAQVEFNFFPVESREGQRLGGVILVRDTSVQLELQRQLNDLYAIATLDPLTQVANRAEFERILNEYIESHRAVGLRCSIVVADIDFFKKINDQFGHHIGDQALVNFAGILKQHVRPHDFVARFGGEEFVILCGHCAEDAAANRANKIRQTVETTPQTILGGKPMTASFGVAELSDEDDATSLFVRADHALLKAKASGRNCVIQSSNMKIVETHTSSLDSHSIPDKKEWRPLNYRPILHQEFCTPMILPMFIERVKSTALELDGQVLHVSEGALGLSVLASLDSRPNQKGTIFVDIDFMEVGAAHSARRLPEGTKLLIRIAMRPKKGLFLSRDHAGIAQSLMRRLRLLLTLDARSEWKEASERDPDADRYSH